MNLGFPLQPPRPPKVYVSYFDDEDNLWHASFPSDSPDHARRQFDDWAAREGVVEVSCAPLNLYFHE